MSADARARWVEPDLRPLPVTVPKPARAVASEGVGPAPADGLDFGRLGLTVSGVRADISYFRRGGPRTPIVFLHGFGGSKEDFADVAFHSAFDGHALLAYDAPGFGSSTVHDPREVTIRGLARFAEAVMDALGIERAHLVGHSMGGLSALLAARTSPDRFASIVSIEGNVAPEDCFLSRRILTHPAPTGSAFLGGLADALRDDPEPAYALYAANLVHKVTPGVVEPVFRSMVEATDHESLIEDLNALPMPRLFMYGDRNRGLSYLERLEEGGVALYEVAHSSHFPMYSNPVGMWEGLAAFLAGADATDDFARHDSFFHVSRPSGTARAIANGVQARLHAGAKSMVSVVHLGPNAEGPVHHHVEEQWGVLLTGSAVRIQGGREIAVTPGAFWHTPSEEPHGLRAGPNGALVVDFFAPPRADYLVADSGTG